MNTYLQIIKAVLGKVQHLHRKILKGVIVHLLKEAKRKMKNKEKYASKEKEKEKEKEKMHGCKRVFQEMWELYDVTLQVIVTFKFM